MAYLNFGGNIMKFGSSIMNSGESFVINAFGKTFPAELDDNNNGIIILEFSTPEIVTINYGDGTIINYTASFISAGRYQVHLRKKGANTSATNINLYTYADGLSLPRVVSFSFDRSKLILISIELQKLAVGDLLFEITKYPSLKTFNVFQVGSVVGLNLEGSFASSLVETVQINNAFHSTSPYYSAIPSSFFLMPLKTLSVGSFGMGGSFVSSKLDQIYLLAATLTYLKIQGTPLTDNHFGMGSLPANFNLLVNLTRFELIETSHTIIPYVLNNIPSIKNLYIGYTSLLTSWGDISSLINLEVLTINNSVNLSVTLPAYFSNFVNLRSMIATGVLRTQLRVDTWVDNWYTFITTNAAMTGANTLPFRGMNHNIAITTIGDGTASPAGTYQQPTGYVAGSNNGTPASPKEKIWVMVNQYGHNWTTN